MNEMRQLARRLAFLLIYEKDMGKRSLDDVLQTLDDADLLCDLIEISAFYSEDNMDQSYRALWQAAVIETGIDTKPDQDITEENEETLSLEDMALAIPEKVASAVNAIAFIRQSVGGVYEHLDAIDELMNKHARRWRMARMHSADRNILRLAGYELCFSDEHKDAPLIINEAVELAKVYGEDDSYKFINAILDAVYKDEALK